MPDYGVEMVKREVDRGGGCGFDGEGGGGGGCGRGDVGREEHVVGLHGGADKEAGERDDWEAETFDEVLVEEGLG